MQEDQLGNSPSTLQPGDVQIGLQETNSSAAVPWYKDRRSWLAIICLLFIPIPIVGVILMWMVAPWSSKAKKILSLIFIGLPLVILLSAFLLMSSSTSTKREEAIDMRRKSDIENIVTAARNYCIEKQECPANLEVLTENDFSNYLHFVPKDPQTGNSYIYELVDGNQNCVVKAILTNGEVYTRSCLP